MEQTNMKDILKEIALLRVSVEEIKEIILEDSRDISDEVNTEVLESRKRPLELFVSQEDIESEFLDED